MGKGQYLGEFELYVMAALARLGDEAYGMTIRRDMPKFEAALLEEKDWRRVREDVEVKLLAHPPKAAAAAGFWSSTQCTRRAQATERMIGPRKRPLIP